MYKSLKNKEAAFSRSSYPVGLISFGYLLGPLRSGAFLLLGTFPVLSRLILPFLLRLIVAVILALVLVHLTDGLIVVRLSLSLLRLPPGPGALPLPAAKARNDPRYAERRTGMTVLMSLL
jgi:hypothetical protein